MNGTVPYIPHTAEDISEMLATIGVKSVDELFIEIPENLKVKDRLDIPNSLDEHSLLAHLFGLSRQNKNTLSDLVCFLGAGMYDRYIPASVGTLISRGEFLTAYTPYQPEYSQGYLQTIYEFQTMVAELYGCEIANASMYDGATSMAEAAILAHSVNGRKRVVVSDAVHPHYRQVLETYCWSIGLEVVVVPHAGGTQANPNLDAESACYIVQTPNFFGAIEDIQQASTWAKASGAMLVVVCDPTSCGLLVPPGALGADIVVGEGQPLGIAMGFGGPALGLFACRRDLARRIPGRIVGRTTDANGTGGYVMTLRTREQDIRREKATSNICTNEALMALAATIYLSAMGTNGMKMVAETSVRNTQYAISQLKAAGVNVKFDNKVFCEFVVELPTSAKQFSERALERGFLAGLPLGDYYTGMDNCLLVAVTETRTKDEIDAFAAFVREEVR